MLSANENRWDSLILPAAAAENVPPALVKAVIWNETRFTWVGDPHPVTGRIIRTPADLDREEPRIGDASVGVMQLLTKTAAWVVGRPVSRDELRDPGFNIATGSRLLGAYLNGWRPGDGGEPVYGFQPLEPAAVLAAYNGGLGILERRTAAGTFPNQGYVNAGLSAYDYFLSLERPSEVPQPEPAAAPPSEGAPPGGGPDSTLVILALVGVGIFGAILLSK